MNNANVYTQCLAGNDNINPHIHIAIRLHLAMTLFPTFSMFKKDLYKLTTL